MEKIKIQKRAEEFGKRKLYKKEQSVAVMFSEEPPFMSKVISMDKCEGQEDLVKIYCSKNLAVNSYHPDWVRPLTHSEKKLLGSRKFADVEFIEPKAVKPKEKPFPKNWTIEVTKENEKMLNEFKLSKGKLKLNSDWHYINCTGNGFNKTELSFYTDKGYKLITTDQFRTHVLKQTNKPKEVESKQFPEFWATPLTPKIKELIEDVWQSHAYSDNTEPFYFHFPNWDTKNGFLSGSHVTCNLQDGYTFVTESEVLAHYQKENKPKEEKWIPKVGDWAKVVDLNVKGDSLTRTYYYLNEVFQIEGLEKDKEYGFWLWKVKGKECTLTACVKAEPNEIPTENPDKKRIDELEKQVSNLNRINEILESDIKAEKKHNNDLAKENKELKMELDELTFCNNDYVEQIDTKNAQITDLTAEVNRLQETIRFNNLHTLDLLKLNNN